MFSNTTKERSFYVDSMYEMDAPMYYDFNATHDSINDSIFDKKIVGETCAFAQIGSRNSGSQCSEFTSPSTVFRDIGNVTPVLKSTLKKTMGLTPEQSTPVHRNFTPRSVTRSMSRMMFLAAEADNTLMAEQLLPSSSPHNATSTSDAVVSFGQSLQTQICEQVHNIRIETEEPSVIVQNHSERVTDKGRVSMNIQQLDTVLDKTDHVNKTQFVSPAQTRSSLLSGGISSVDRVCPRNQELGKETLVCAKPPSPPHRRPRDPSGPNRTHRLGGLPLVRKPSLSQLHGKSTDITAAKPTLRKRTASADGKFMKATLKQSLEVADKNALRSRTRSGPVSNATVSISRRAAAAAVTVGSPLSRLMRPTTVGLMRMRTQSAQELRSPTKRKNLDAVEAKPTKVPSLTVQTTPLCLKRKSRLTPGKTSEEIEMERIEKEKGEIAQLKRCNALSLRRSVRRSVDSILQATSQCQNEQLPSNRMVTTSLSNKQKEIASSTTSLSNKQKHNVVSTTSLSNKQKEMASSTTCLSNKQKENTSPTVAAKPAGCPKATCIPLPPHALHGAVTGSVTSLTEFSSNKPAYGHPAKATVPRSPRLRTKLRSSWRHSADSAERVKEEVHQFKAHPVNKRIFERPSGVGERVHLPVTRPISPRFATDQRVKEHARLHSAKDGGLPSQLTVEPITADPIVLAPVRRHEGLAFKSYPDTRPLGQNPGISKPEDSKQIRLHKLRQIEEEEKKLWDFKARSTGAPPVALSSKKT